MTTTSVKQNFRASRPLKDMLLAGVIKGDILDFGCGKGGDMNYLIQELPYTKYISGYDANLQPHMSHHTFDTIFCNNVINYIKTEAAVKQELMKAINKLKPGGRLILTARKFAEVSGNVKRNSNWKRCGIGYISEKDVYQQGYDDLDLKTLLEDLNMKLITDSIDIGAVPYAYAVAVKP